ncbi:FG-GAP-like repeat-containing protein [Streptomyces sp. NPDC059002]|uniref:FG-GAP-like repeat-containing protein n=1 Tax=Streptomyces sp. NPDC059002 TaxID=3346690 RepID=UPI0036AC1E9A
MSRHVRARGGIAAVAALATGLLALTPQTAAVAAGSAETVIDATPRFAPRTETLHAAGRTGYVHREEGGDIQWTDYATGESRTAPAANWWNGSLAGRYSQSTRTLDLTDLDTGEAASITVPEGRTWAQKAFTDRTAVTYERGAEGRITAFHLLRAGADGQVTEQAVSGLPDDVTSFAGVRAQDRDGAVVMLRSGPSTNRAFLLDYRTGKLTRVFAGLEGRAVPSGFALSKDRVLGYWAEVATAYTVDRDRADAQPVQTSVPGPVQSTTRRNATMALAGDRILVVHKEALPQQHVAQPLFAVRIGGGGHETLLKHATTGLATADDGSVLAVGGTSASDWAVRRVSDDGSGGVKLGKVRDIEPVRAAIQGMALGGGRLTLGTTSPINGLGTFYDYDLAVDGDPKVVSGPTRGFIYGLDHKRCAPTGPDCVRAHATGNGRVVYSAGDSAHMPTGTNSFRNVTPGAGPVTVTDASGRYSLLRKDGTDKFYVGDTEQSDATSVTHTLTARSAAVWGTKVWKPAATAGSVDSYDLKSKKTGAAVKLGSGCVPNELQAVGRWLYWACGGKAGVWDQTAKKNIAVPAGGPVLLADGYLVRQNGIDLDLTDFHKGASAAAVTTTGFARVPSGARAGVDWTVDKYGGPIAYADAERRVHVKPVSVPRSPITSIESRVGSDNLYIGGSSKEKWKGSWQLSRPATAWKVTFTDGAGKTAATVAGSARGAASVSAEWNGRTADGKKAVSGTYAWKVSAKGAGDSAYRSVKTGTLRLSGGTAPYRDAHTDGRGDLYTVNSKGALTAHDFGGGSHTKASKAGWNTKYTYVPFGDLSGNGCNDLLVRNTAGTLHRYNGACSGPPAPGAAKVSLGGGWGAYNVLTSPGDLNGDGIPDLIARKAATGDMYVFRGTKAGKLTSGVRIGTNWKAYTHITGVGDVNGDGIGDVLARHKDGTLFRFEGGGDGKLKGRVTVFKGWGAPYTHVIGSGDVTGDGIPDLVVRDKKGDLYRNTGKGKGAFSGRTKIASGWLTYKGIF